MSLVAPKASEMGGFGESLLEVFSRALDFHFLMTLTMTYHLFLAPGTSHNRSFLDVFLKVAFGRPLGINLCRCWSIWGSLGEAVWLQNGVQRPSPKNDRKRVF